MERLPLKEDVGHDGEDDERDALLDDLELHEAEGTAVALEADAVGRHLAAIFKESDAPRENDDAQQGPIGRDARLLQPQVTVPGQRHEDVAAEKQQNGINSGHESAIFRGAKLGKITQRRDVRAVLILRARRRFSWRDSEGAGEIVAFAKNPPKIATSGLRAQSGMHTFAGDYGAILCIRRSGDGLSQAARQQTGRGHRAPGAAATACDARPLSGADVVDTGAADLHQGLRGCVEPHAGGAGRGDARECDGGECSLPPEVWHILPQGRLHTQHRRADSHGRIRTAGPDGTPPLPRTPSSRSVSLPFHKIRRKAGILAQCITFAIQIQKIMEAGITKPNKQSVSFRWSPELVEKLKKIARQQNRSFSNFTETILSRAVSIMDQAEEDVPNATTAAAINEAKEHRKKHKAGLSGDSSIDTSSVDAMIRTTLR